jgi:hypothetical protein
MESWCSDCTGLNRRCSEPSSSTSRSPPIDLPHTSRKIGTHPTITRAWLPGARARVEPWNKDELDWVDMWQDPARSRLLRWDKRTETCHSSLVLLSWWSPLSQEGWDYIWYGVCGSLVICRWRELGHIQICWVITGGTRYPGYMTPTIAPEPSVGRVAGAVHSTRGRSDTHMSL